MNSHQWDHHAGWQPQPKFEEDHGYKPLPSQNGGQMSRASSLGPTQNRGPTQNNGQGFPVHHSQAAGGFPGPHIMGIPSGQPNQSGDDPNGEDATDEEEHKGFFKQLVGINTSFETLYIFNFFTAGVHAISAVVIFIIAVGIEANVAVTEECGFRNFTDTNGPYIVDICVANNTLYNRTGVSFYRKQEEIFDERIYLAVLITMFFTLSALFQGGQGCFKEAYRERVETNQANAVRYIEYSLSASIMMLGLASVLAIMDIYTHILIFTCTMLCMMLGLVADYLRVMEFTIRSDVSFPPETTPDTETDESVTPLNLWQRCAKDLRVLKWGVHALSWVAILVPFLFVFSVAWNRVAQRSGTCSQNQDSVDTGPPTWVTGIIITEFILFLLFGVVQSIQFGWWTEDSQKRIGIRTEHLFITLSALSKSLLGWFIVANVFMR
jgi:hypothetical protein